MTLHIPMEVTLCTSDPHCHLLSAFVAAPECAVNVCCWKAALEASGGTRRPVGVCQGFTSWTQLSTSASALQLTCLFRLDHWIWAHVDQQLIDRSSGTRWWHLLAPSLRWNQVQQRDILQPLWRIVTQIRLPCILDAVQKQYWTNQSQLAWVEWVKEEPALQRGHWCATSVLSWSRSFGFFMAAYHLKIFYYLKLITVLYLYISRSVDTCVKNDLLKQNNRFDSFTQVKVRKEMREK